MNDNYNTNIEDKAQILSECWGITYEEAKKIIEEENMKFNLRKTIEENSKNILNAHMEALIKENKELKAQNREYAKVIKKLNDFMNYDKDFIKCGCFNDAYEQDEFMKNIKKLLKEVEGVE